ncbi:hypothetical protein BpHYR1_009989 [Brachionus plicatilis]|uniref:Uncharacterized protein n=1 Tax=Brachionus plicatilis TaxID=10195 RepID=A0A3M7RGH6_BRAPC|nr:hypothetical protein BpHYR1_009989 [Brachionus plicatilis]
MTNAQTIRLYGFKLYDSHNDKRHVEYTKPLSNCRILVDYPQTTPTLSSNETRQKQKKRGRFPDSRQCEILVQKLQYKNICFNLHKT